MGKFPLQTLWWSTADTENKVPSGENPDLSRFPSFKLIVGQNTALEALLTVKIFTVLSFVFPGNSASFFPSPLPT